MDYLQYSDDWLDMSEVCKVLNLIINGLPSIFNSFVFGELI